MVETEYQCQVLRVQVVEGRYLYSWHLTDDHVTANTPADIKSTFKQTVARNFESMVDAVTLNFLQKNQQLADKIFAVRWMTYRYKDGGCW